MQIAEPIVVTYDRDEMIAATVFTTTLPSKQ